MLEELPHFIPLEIQDNPLGWGPYGMPDQFNIILYQPFSKGDPIGKIVDWTIKLKDKRYMKKYQSQFNGGTQYTYYHEEDESPFKLVDTARAHHVGYLKRGRMIRGQGSSSGSNQFQCFGTLNKQQWDRMQRWNKIQFVHYNKNNMQMKSRDTSVVIRADWNTIEELDFVSFSKLSLSNIKDPEDLVCCGSLEYYNKSYDSINLQNEKPLKHIDRIFHTVTTTDDPIIRKLVKTVGNVYATDTILACLMCCTRSKYSWDIIVEKVGGKLFFDKRENTEIDLLTVNETAENPPSDEANSLNSPRNLALEATLINQNFSQQVLKCGQPRYKFDEPNPFILDDETEGKVASVAYRYRKWNIDNGIVLVARCEHNSVLQISNGDLQFLTIKALNEWDSKVFGKVEWRRKLDIQRTGVLVTELRNNAYKFAKWTIQALLAGSDYMKFGYVSRVQVQDSSKHVILGTQQYKPSEFAAQINLNMNNAWGILRFIIDLCMKQKDGKYLIMKDPNKPLIRLYSIPDNTFDSDIEDNEVDGSGKISTVPAELLPPNP